MARMPAAAAWSLLRYDPAAVLLIVRQTAPTLQTPSLSFFPAAHRDPAVLQGALSILDTDSGRGWLAAEALPSSFNRGFVDWSLTSTQPIYAAALRYARTAYSLAGFTGRSDPENAWVAGLLAPLGWLSVCAANADEAAACLVDPQLAQDPVRNQQRHWGTDQAAIARRLGRRWRMPRWLALVVGHLGLPLEVAVTLGADPDLFRIVQTAVALVDRRGFGLRLAVGAAPADHAVALSLAGREQEALLSEIDAPAEAPAELLPWSPPSTIPFLRDVLVLAAENYRLRDAPALEQLELERDRLHEALEQQRTGEAERLQALKMRALVEFAAGAAHEINNPLAVISGQAQYLLSHESEPARQRALHTIIGQAQRVHQVLTELMQFARPPTPERQLVEVRGLVREVALSLGDLAGQRQVQLVCPEAEHSTHISADPRQVRTALECLLRNAIEAAPPGGWAGVRVELPAADRLELIVEDNGDGPLPAQREHLFDPFYSGRSAGRGRGLGLPTAWRLAREQGGDVRHEDQPGGPTRFVLTLPREPGSNGHTSVNGRPAPFAAST
jgi:signal transduction histidine kinase